MGQYVGSFGLVRISGRGEGRDEKYNVSAKPALGANKLLRVIVDENGPVANVDSHYGRDGQYLPKGAVVVKATLLTEVKGLANAVVINLVDKEGGNSVALLEAATPAGNNAVNEAAGAAIGTRLERDMYFVSSGTKTGLKAELLVEYI